MFMMTAKVDKTKIIVALGAVAVTIALLLALFGGGSGNPEPTAATLPPADSNDGRVQFLSSLGWEVTVSPVESMQIRIPRESSEVFDRYNDLQKSQGFDLSRYAGKTVMRYVYQINNYPGATEPVYASILVSKDEIIGGDITDTAPGGKIQGFVRRPGS